MINYLNIHNLKMLILSAVNKYIKVLPENPLRKKCDEITWSISVICRVYIVLVARLVLFVRLFWSIKTIGWFC